MSAKATSWAWQQPQTGSDKLVLLALADSANDDGACWPGQRALARKTGCGERTVVSALGRLEGAGLIARTHRQRADGSRTSDFYVLALSGEANLQHLQDGQPAKSAGHEPTERNALPTVGIPHSSARAFSLNGTMPTGVTDAEAVVLAAVEKVGRAKRAKPGKAATVVDHCRRFADRDLVGAAERFVHYWTEGGGENRKVRDVVATWRNWIEQAPTAGKRGGGQAPTGQRRMTRHERRREAALRTMAADEAAANERRT